ncbi:MAG TPA: 3-oxoacyl-ACP synthase, partial [Nocardioides sp.]|nr:3-oxoacyl-ACP synthase [Nocardioides sp.]
MTIQQPTDLVHAAMLGLGVHRPDRLVTNDEICEVLDSSDEWIQTRSGIRTRRFAGEGETLIGMSVSAAEKALAAAGVGAEQVGCVIVATSTHPEHTPASAPQVASALGITAAAFDISAGCAGFCHALNLAS